jgi:hypothetical protein
VFTFRRRELHPVIAVVGNLLLEEAVSKEIYTLLS